MADLNHPKCFKLYDLFTKRLFICITYLSLEIQWCYFWCIILMLVCSLWKHLIWRQCCIMVFWHIDTSQGQASVELSSLRAVQWPADDGSISWWTGICCNYWTKSHLLFPNSTHQCICTFITLLLYCGSFLKRRSPWDIWWPCVHWDYFCMTCFPPTVSALTQQLFACCGLVIISWVFNKNSSVKWSVVHSCLFCFCFLGAAGVLVGHPFDTVKVGVCCFLFDVCSLVAKN